MTVAIAPLSVADLIVAEETERGGAGARLHDGPVQDLLATRYLADLALTAADRGADAETLRVHLESIREAAVVALAGSRRAMSDLTGRCTDGRGLAGALRATASAVGTTASVVTGNAADAELGTLPPAVAVVAHRLSGAMLRGLEEPGAVLAAYVESGWLVLSLSVAVDLSDPAISGWVERAQALNAEVKCADNVTTVRFPLDTPSAPEGAS